MRDRGWILGAFALLVALALWPVWRALASAPPRPPDLARPAGATACVAPVDVHAGVAHALLETWRDRVVRDGVRTYTDGNGRAVTMSLTGTCLGACHTDKATFCDRCHDYAGVTPTCWNCHVAPPPGRARRRPADDAGPPPVPARGRRRRRGGRGRRRPRLRGRRPRTPPSRLGH